MALLTVEKASLAFGHVPLLDQVDFSLDPGEVVGLIGRNGAGKSSMLKAIDGAIKLDYGRVVARNDVKSTFVSQEPVFEPGHTVFEAVSEGLGELSSLLKEYHQITHSLSDPDADHTEALEKMEDIQHRLEANNGW